MERVGGEGAEEGPQADGVTPGHSVEGPPQPWAPAPLPFKLNSAPPLGAIKAQ